MHDWAQVFQQKVFHLEHVNLHPWGLDSLIPSFQTRHGLWGGERVMTPKLNNSALSLATVTTSGPRETIPAGSVYSPNLDADISCKTTKYIDKSPSRDRPWCKNSPNSNTLKQMSKQINKRQKTNKNKTHTQKSLPKNNNNSSSSFPEAAFKKRERKKI